MGTTLEAPVRGAADPISFVEAVSPPGGDRRRDRRLSLRVPVEFCVARADGGRERLNRKYSEIVGGIGKR